MNLSSLVGLIGVSIGLMALLICLIKHRSPAFGKMAFLLMLGCLTYYASVIFLIDSGMILKYPHFFKTGSPFFYLLAISILWMGESRLRGKNRLQFRDYLLLMIPVLHVLELMPFYSLTKELKTAYLQGLFPDRDKIIYATEGWIPTYFHFILQVVLGLIATGYVLWLVRKERQNHPSPHPTKWLQELLLTFMVFYASSLILLLVDTPDLPMHELACWLFALMLVVQLFFLFFRPEILYGLPVAETSPKATSIPLDAEEAADFRLKIEDFFIHHTDYLRADFRQQHLADFLGISKSRLSTLIQQLFRQSFNQLINEKRIQAAIHKLESKKWENLTLEGIALEVGFKSRTTFIKAFQEKTGLSPSQFRRQIQRN